MAALIGHIAAPHNMTTALANASKAKFSENLEQVAHLMPEMLQELGERIGLQNAFAISKAMGGTRVYIPKGLECDLSKKIIKILGSELLAQQLSNLYGGDVIYIPQCSAVERALRDIEIHRTAEIGIASGRSMNSIVNELAFEHRLSDRYIWKILKAPPQTFDNRATGNADALHPHPKKTSEIN